MPQLKRSVALLSLTADGKILCISRRNQPDQFGLIAGKVDPGEHDIQAIIREAEEEAGLRLSPYDLVPLYAAAVPASVAGVAYWTTTYLLTRHLDPDEHLVAEEGLILSFKTIPAFLDPKDSPFTDFDILPALKDEEDIKLSSAGASRLWDDAQLVPATNLADGSWQSCPAAGQALKLVANSKFECVRVRAMRSDENKGPAVTMTPEEIIKIHTIVPPGSTAQLVGFLPALLPGANTNLLISSSP